ncbi:MAG TPA: hypothetical protein VN256_05345 [Pyrinomonadaceae bacterium]|nr:hypothetical protein [Pyrinomonadaceae bacterium]
METIRILFYTDKSDISLNPSDAWSVADVKKFIEFKIGKLVQVRVELLNRHIDQATGQLVYGANLLTRKLLNDYDEIWVFGYTQTNLPHRGPQFCSIELYDEEVKYLKDWMDCGGGLMFTGDHSNTNPFVAGGDHSRFLNLGRALGYKIPRARQLRVWEGPPTAQIVLSDPPEKKDNHNTQEGDGVQNLDNLALQSDGITQTLRFEDPKAPHELFRWYKNEDDTIAPISKFPDHMHEGELLIPKLPLDAEWPENSRQPQVAALGRDKRFVEKERLYPLVVAYDGDNIPVGRIVADSSFHHYVKPNLSGIRDRDPHGYPVRGSDLDQVAQFYGNMAYWLAPKVIRDKVKSNLLFELAKHPDVFEVQGSNAEVVGNAARSVAELEIGRANLDKLFSDDNARGFDALMSLSLTGKGAGLEYSLEDCESALGIFIKVYHEAFRQQVVIDPGMLRENPIPVNLAEEKFVQAFTANSALLEKLAGHSQERLESFLSDLGFSNPAPSSTSKDKFNQTEEDDNGTQM